VILPWDDTRIKPGQDWRREIREAVETAVVAVLLISADFLASTFIKDNELPPLLEAAEEDGLTILPVILKPCRFRKALNLERFQAVNDTDRPMVNLSIGEQDEVWVKTVDCIEDAIRQSTPEARQEIELAQMRAEARAYLLNEEPYKDAFEFFDRIPYDRSLTASDRQELVDSLYLSLVDGVIICIGHLLTEAQIEVSSGSGRHNRRWQDRLTVASREMDRWSELRGTSRMEEAIHELLQWRSQQSPLSH